VLVGLIFLAFVYRLMQPNQPQMLLGVYATLGIFLLLAATATQWRTENETC
jgi:hypothetical protein